MSLRSYVPDQIWLRAYPVQLAGTRFDARMTVIRLSSGEIMLHSPCAIGAPLAEEISALGRVAHIVAPGNFHHVHGCVGAGDVPECEDVALPGNREEAARSAV